MTLDQLNQQAFGLPIFKFFSGIKMLPLPKYQANNDKEIIFAFSYFDFHFHFRTEKEEFGSVNSNYFKSILD